MNIKKILLITYLAALGALAPFSTDIYLASMPVIQKLYSASGARVQLTLSLFFISFAVAQLAWGPLSDRIGRKPVMIIGILIFILASVGCALSTTITALIIARVIQAIGACSGIVIAIAMAKDCYPDHHETSRVLGFIMSTLILAPVVAPIIGSYLLVHINWQANFYFLTAYAVALLLGSFFVTESHHMNTRHPLPIHRLLHAYIDQLKHAPFTIIVLAVATNFSVLFSFIASSPFIYIKIYHLDPKTFSGLFAMNAAALVLGTLSVSKLKKQFHDMHIMLAAAAMIFCGSLLMTILLLALHHSVWAVALPMVLITYGVGLLYAELTSYALKHVVSFIGLASSLIGTVRFSLAAFAGFLMGIVITQSAMPLAISMLALSVLTICCILCYRRQRDKG